MKSSLASLLSAVVLTLPVSAGPHHGHPYPHRASPRGHAYFGPHHTHCWRWDGVRWIWVPFVSVQVGDVVYIGAGCWRVNAPAAPHGAGFVLGIEVYR